MSPPLKSLAFIAAVFLFIALYVPLYSLKIRCVRLPMKLGFL